MSAFDRAWAVVKSVPTDGHYEKLEYIHSTLQECLNEVYDQHMIQTSLQFVEEMREIFFELV